MENQDKYLEQLRIFSFDSLCNLENHCWEAEDYFSFNLSMLADPVPAIGKFDLLKLIHKIKNEYLKIHIKPEDFVEIIRDEMNYSDQRLHYAHLVYCEECFDKFKEYRLACSVFIDKKLEELVNSVNSKNSDPAPTESSKAEANDSNDDESESEDDLDNSNDDEPEAKEELINSVNSKNSNPAPTESSKADPSDPNEAQSEAKEELINSVNSKNSNPAPAESSKADPDDPNEVQSEAKAEEKPETPVTEPVKTNTIAVKKYLIYAIIFIIPLLVISMLWFGNRYGIKSQNEQIALLDKAHREENPVQLAYLFEEISKKIESDRTKAIFYLARAVVAEKLLLLERNEQDKEQYYKLTGERMELVQKQKVYEPDVYDKLETLIDGYLLARSSGDSNLAVTHLNNAKKLALQIEAIGDKLGIDLVKFYSKLPDKDLPALQQARQRKNILAMKVSIDSFEDSIRELTRLNNVFQSYQSEVDAESTAFLLAKFLLKSGNQDKALKLLDSYLPTSEKSSHKLSQAKFLFLKGDVFTYRGQNLTASKYHLESFEILKDLPPNLFELYPLYTVVSRQSNIGNPELAITDGTKALSLSLSAVTKSEKFYGGFASVFGQFQGLSAKNLNLTYLSEEYLTASINIAQKHNLAGYVIEAKCLLSVLHVKQGNVQNALAELEKAKSFMSTDPLAKVSDEALISAYKGKIFGMSGNYSISEGYYRTAVALLEQRGISNLIYHIQAFQGLGEALWLQGKEQEALIYLEKVRYDLAEIQKGLQVVEKVDEFRRLNFTDKTPDQIIKSIND